MNHWRYIEEDGVSADYGLATDEYLVDAYFRNASEKRSALRLYTYRDHCGLVGRFQNIRAELDLDFCRRHDIQIGRRATGGGAILMGSGQLGLCLASSGPVENTKTVFEKYSEPLIAALGALGIEARFRPKNDLEVDGRKIAGLGLYVNPQGAIQFHASLLVDLDIPLMLKVLQIPMQKISDKELIASVEQRITTVSTQLSRKVDTGEVRQLVKKAFTDCFNISLDPEPVAADEKQKIDTIARKKYLSDDWIFQRSPLPDMNGMGLKKTPAGLLRTYVAMKGETIKSLLITGDFFDHGEAFNKIEAALKWQPFDRTSITRTVNRILRPENNGPDLSVADVVDVIWMAGENAKSLETQQENQ